MDGFKKRSYKNPCAFLKDMGFLLKNQKRIRAIFRGKFLAPAFRERIMLSVTHVNKCRHCASFHAKAALTEKISREEIKAILDGQFNNCPKEEITGILYAEHWAETYGKPDAAVYDKFVSDYGQRTADDIYLVLRVIKTGNFSLNSLESLLYKVSFGKWGT